MKRLRDPKGTLPHDFMRFAVRSPAGGGPDERCRYYMVLQVARTRSRLPNLAHEV